MNKGHLINDVAKITSTKKEARQTPRYKEFVQEIGLVDNWNKFGWPDLCHQLDNGDFECN